MTRPNARSAVVCDTKTSMSTRTESAPAASDARVPSAAMSNTPLMMPTVRALGAGNAEEKARWPVDRRCRLGVDNVLPVGQRCGAIRGVLRAPSARAAVKPMGRRSPGVAVRPKRSAAASI